MLKYKTYFSEESKNFEEAPVLCQVYLGLTEQNYKIYLRYVDYYVNPMLKYTTPCENESSIS